MDKDRLKELASNLMFDMEDSEYETLSKEFEVILKQMDIISHIDGIEDVEPMHFPFPIDSFLREDEVSDMITTEEVLENAKEKETNQVKVPKVV